MLRLVEMAPCGRATRVIPREGLIAEGSRVGLLFTGLLRQAA